MKSGTHIALAVAAGYVLGRRRKAKLALMMGGAAATGGFGGVTRQLLKRGTHLVGSSGALGKISPELGEVTDLVRTDLVDAGKAAALTAVRGRIDKMSDRLHERAGALLPDEAGAGAEKAREQSEKVRGRSEKVRGRSGKVRRRTEPEDEAEPQDEAEEAGEPEDYAEAGEDEEFDEPEDAADAQDYDEEAEPEEADAEDFDEDEDAEDAELASSGNGRRSRSSSGGSPIRRTRR